MVDRLRSTDLAVLAQDSAQTPMHNIAVEIFDPRDSQLDYPAIMEHIQDRISFVPRYRQRLQRIPGRIGNPVWVDDTDFDLSFHVRRSALPRPGSLDQLRDLAARIASRPLDHQRPLWEAYFVEGLDGGKVALLTKSHEILVDGISTVDLGQVLLDMDPMPHAVVHDAWDQVPPPNGAQLVVDALTERFRRPGELLISARNVLNVVTSVTDLVPARVTDVVSAALGRGRVQSSPFNVAPSEQRRLVVVRTALKDYRRVRHSHGGTVNDVILATLTGAIRSWLMVRAEHVDSSRRIRALVPMSVIDEDLEPTSLGSHVIGHVLDLPIGESSPVVRLHQVSYALRAHSETGKAVAADRIAGVAGFAPTTFHALGARLAATNTHTVNVVITNVPGPQFPMYLAGAELVETYPVPPLHPGFGLAIGVTSYDGGVYYGITADRDALPDIDFLGHCVTEALEELVDSGSTDRPGVPRGRKKPSG